MVAGVSGVKREEPGSCLHRASDPHNVINGNIVAAQGAKKACLRDTKENLGVQERFQDERTYKMEPET